MKPILSILIPTIPGREQKLSTLMDKLATQIGELPVEILAFSDNRQRTIGDKRTGLVTLAQGDYIAFVDDDDDVSTDYVKSILEAAKQEPDVITFRQHSTYNGLESIVEFHAKNQDGPFRPGGVTLRAPWHVCAWRRSKVAGCVFGRSNYGEDIIWCLQARQRVKTSIHIPKILHFYRHDASETAAPEPS
jgi:hypothetical protein